MLSTLQATSLLTGTEVVLSSPAGAAAEEVVALAHGAGGGVRENFAPLLALGQQRLTGPYYPGAGGTPRARAPLQLDHLADQVVASGLRAGAERFPVVGFSLGAAVAVTAALRHPEHVSALVLTVPLLRPDAQTRAVSAVWQRLAREGDLDTLAAFLGHVSFSAAELTGLDPAAHQRLLAETRAGYPPGGLEHIELVDRVDLTGWLSRLGVPTLVVVAGADRIVLPETARGYAAIPGARLLEYPDAGHLFSAEQARRWARDVSAFCDRR